MSSRGNSVYVHQSTSSRSSSSSGRSVASGPRPSTTTTYREYGATGHTSQVTRSGQNTIVQHNKRHYDPSSPSPSYRS
ncbi:hypothetical protein TGAMA5MH_10452 [Trichoderma gamsii]|uniref:Uncharacterized protein n=1 Tax=Trichoderma gamsii TaxID=398673 RepID=A0A2K0SWG0_9HYPO|nr:hypothetical protein TGAMA5MH_10452 [Trichoderma gamsii]